MKSSKFFSIIPWATAIVALLFSCLVGLFHIHNADIWWHLSWGEKMLQLHTIFPSAEDFYFTPTDAAYLRQLPNTFLGDIFFALLYRMTGIVGLQLLVIFFLIIAGAAIIFFIFKKTLLQKKENYAIALFLFFALCLGTCQLQMVRNALFSLALFPITLALFHWHSHVREGWKVLWIYPLFFLFWSVIHSSYALGFIALILLYTGLLLDRFLKRPCFLSMTQVCTMLVAPLLLFFISFLYSHQIRSLVAGFFFHGITLLSHALHLEALPNSSFLVENSLRPSWEAHSKPLSGDFITTWKVLRHPAAWTSMLLSSIAFVLLLCTRPRNKFGLAALLAFTTYFGICYLRGTGYATITALFVITSILADPDKKRISVLPENIFLFLKSTLPLLSSIICAIALFGMMGVVLSKQSEFFFKERERVFGFGKAALFDEAPYLFVKREFGSAPCFTTIVTGSYASFLWNSSREPETKKVFIDGFFSPHPPALWHDYRTAVRVSDISLLEGYGLQVAIVENSRFDWQYAFLRSSEWRPVAIGLGATVYAQKRALPIPTMPVTLLFTQDDVVHNASPTVQRAVAAAYYNCILSLGFHGMTTAANNLMTRHEELFETLANGLDPSQRENIRFQPKGIKPILLRP